MPAFFTHYLFGKVGYRRMEEGTLKKMVRRHKEVYALGLSGPDIFFYFVLHQLRKEKPSLVMHKRACGAFLRHMFEDAMLFAGEEREAAMAYLAGFLGHYELDSYCHPHVYQYIGQAAGENAKEKEKTGIHFRYEGAMDCYFLKNYAKERPSSLRQNQLIRLSKKERDVICRLVSKAYNRTYHGSNLSLVEMRMVLRSLQIVMRLLYDPKGRREKLMAFAERAVYGYPFLSGLFVNDNRYQIGSDEWKIMDFYFKKAGKEYDRVNKAFEAALLAEGSQESEKAKEEFYQRIGSRSYHTGLSV